MNTRITISRLHALLRRGAAGRPALVAALAAAATLVPALPAHASTPLPLTPFLDCVTSSGDPARPYIAYFGFNNTGPIPLSFPVGDFNNTFPGSQDSGQPTLYGTGNYPRAFSAVFDGAFIPTLTWELNNIEVSASANSPRCTSGITAPASELTSTAATLNGAVVPDGTDTTYSFEYGTSASFGNTTPSQSAGSGTQPTLVQAPLSGLAPGTQYFFRLMSTNAFAGTTHGEIKTFTTPTAATATPPLTIDTTNLSSGAVASHYADVITASGGMPKDTWTVTGGSLPDGLQLASGTGVISGVPTTAGTFGVAVQVSDAASPAASVSHSFTIVIDRAQSTTRLIGSTRRPRVGLPFTVSAIVDAAGGSLPATGEVSFTDNGTPVTCTGGSASLDDRDVATCALVLSRSRSHSIIARYAGDRRVAGSSSTPLTVSVAGRHSWHRAKRR